MCDQTEVVYHDGDVVWVKMGPVWWPGIVKDVDKDGSGKEILAGLRSKPIAVVKFFDEDAYEFVKNLDNIYHYNCRRKEEFIKKGLEKHRRGASHMKKFPDDVKTAQKLVNEDENIINSPKFAPPEKINYNELFGTTPKKKPKTDDLKLRTKILPLKKRLSAPVTTAASSPRVTGSNACSFCDFSINSLDVLLAHIKYNHTSKRADYSAPGSAPAKPKPSPIKRRHTTVPKPKKQPEKPAKTAEVTKEVKTAVKTVVNKPEKSSEKKKRYTDVLLADWSEDDQNRSEDEEEEEEEKPKTDLNENNNATPEKKKEEETKKDAKKETSSCFDFDEEDDGFIGMSNANTYGRKIPRVIPDKIELGMDPEIEELFKRKPESEQEEETPPPVKRKRGRPPKGSKAVIVEPPAPKQSDDSIAMTRERRTGALKSYVGEIIEKIAENDDEEPPKPPSRRKQDLKRQSLKEFDELEELAKRKMARNDKEYVPPASTIRKKKDAELEAQKKRLSDFDSLESKTEALLAESSRVDDEECIDTTVEYLEDEPQPVKVTASPIKKWKEDIRLAMDTEKKSVIPQWKQDIQEAMKANKESQNIQKIVFGAKNLEPGTSSLVKVSKLTNKGNNTLVIVPESRKIINKQQQLVVLSKQGGNKPIVVTGKPQPPKVTTQPFLKVISDGNGGTKKVVSQKAVQIGTSKTSPSTIVLSGAAKRDSGGIHVMRNFNGTGKTVILGGSGQTIYRRLKTVTPGTSAVKPCIVKTVKSPGSQYKTVRLISSLDKTLTLSPQKRQYIIRKTEPQPVQIVQTAPPQPEPEPQIVQLQQQQQQQQHSEMQQVIAMQQGEGKQLAYMFVRVDSEGNYHQLDPSLLSFDGQQPAETSSSQLYEPPPSDDLTPTYSSPGQDILAEALANTNVLESEMPLTSLIMPTIDGQTVISDNSGLITTPLVQETSVTLQKPIMSPVEVPSSIVADTTGLQPPPLPPTQEELLEETDDNLLIADHQQQQQQVVEQQAQDFFIDDSQEGEANTFQSMPLLTEDVTSAEETITEQQYNDSEYHNLTEPETEQVSQEDLSKYQQQAEDGSAIYTGDGSQLIFVNVPDQPNEGNVVETSQAQQL